MSRGRKPNLKNNKHRLISMNKSMQNKISTICFLIIASIICCTPLSAKKSDSIKPRWLTRSVPISQDGSSVFVVAHGDGSTLPTARQMALYNLTDKMQREKRINVSIESTEVERTEERGLIETSSYSYSSEIILKIKQGENEIPIICRTIDEYWVENNSGFAIDVLYVVPSVFYFGVDQINSTFMRPALENEELIISSNYPMAGFMSLVPGVGQFYKGSIAKGVTFLGLEIATLGCVLLAENTRASYKNKMIEQPKYAKEYQERADNWETIRNVSLGAAGAIYLWNLIDAFTAKGARQVIVKNRNQGGLTAMTIMPYSTLEDAGLSLRIRF